MKRTKWLAALALVFSGGTPVWSTEVKPIAIKDIYGVDSSVYRWDRVPVLLGRAEVSALNSSRPPISCERVLDAAEAASALLKKIFQEQEELTKVLDRLKDASPNEIQAILDEVRRIAAQVEEDHQKLQKLYPAEFQEKDRVRTVYWKINPQDFASLRTFPRIPKIEWAQYEVLSGEGGFFGKFIPQPANERPIKVRFNEFLKRFDRMPDLKAQIENEFSGLLRSINLRFASGTPGARGQIDWQGSGEIKLMQELSPVEACVPHLHLTSALLLDFDVRPPEEYPNPEFTADDQSFRLGMGPVVLRYYQPRN